MEERKSADERKAWLARNLADLSVGGWRVESQSDFHAVVVKKQWFGLEKRQVVEVDEAGNVLLRAVPDQAGQKVRRKVVMWGGVAVAVLVVLAAIGAIVGGGDDTSPSAAADTTNGNAASTQTVTAVGVTGKIRGTFHRDCFACGDLKDYIRTSDAWCGWREDTLLVHVRMSNESVEHVTVSWHPSYIIRGGTEHGAGLSSVQDDGFDAGESRTLVAEQHPEGVTPGAAISQCKPSFFLIESG